VFLSIICKNYQTRKNLVFQEEEKNIVKNAPTYCNDLHLAPCRWTNWMSLDSGGDADKETLAGFSSKYPSYSCPNPSQMKVRRSDTKQSATPSGGPQVFRTFDLKTGFVCLKADQPTG
jgi:Mucin-2 protein WxxW repeating region